MKTFIQMMRHYLKYLGFKFHLNRLNCLDTIRELRILQSPTPYCVSLMVTITSHIFINIFQTVHFSAAGVMRKIWAFFWYQNLRKFEKNLKQSDREPLRKSETKLVKLKNQKLSWRYHSPLALHKCLTKSSPKDYTPLRFSRQ